MINSSITAPQAPATQPATFDYPCLLRIKNADHNAVFFAQNENHGFIMAPRTDIKNASPFGDAYAPIAGSFGGGHYELYPHAVTAAICNRK